MQKQKEQKIDPHTESSGDKKEIFQEVELRRLDPVVENGRQVIRFERVKVVREKVKITQQQADVLNEGRATVADNRYFIAYLKPDQEIEPIKIGGRNEPGQNQTFNGGWGR